MRVLKKNRRYITILLLVLPTIIALNSFIPKTQAGPAIPEPDPQNGWHWDVDEGDQLYFEGEFIITNLTSGEVAMMWKDIWIYNITSIEDVIVNWSGVHEFSQVNATQCYYNVTSGMLESYEYSNSEIALFGYNSTDPTTHRLRAGQNGIPFILPLNSSSVEVDILAPIINETFYYPMGQMAFNSFDYYMSDNNTNQIYFSNSSDGYFVDGYYYDNGTMSSGSAYLRINMDGPMEVNATMTQVFDYDYTDEVEWGVTNGETIYYDFYEGDEPVAESSDVKVEVTSISDVMVDKTLNSFSDEPINMIYEAVFADISLWNGTDYELNEVDIPIGMANNFYPSYFDEGGTLEFTFLYPTSATLEDYMFMYNLDTFRLRNAPFDDINFTENGYIEIIIRNSTGPEIVKSKIDKADGIVQYFLMKMESGIVYYELKNLTLVDWSVNPGDVLYVKDNSEHPRDLRLTIIGTGSAFVNMSAIFQEFNLMGIPAILPSGQPDLQFHSYITAETERWNPSTQSWDYDSQGPIALANTLWPLSPVIFKGIVQGPPILLPEDTSSTDLSNFMTVYGTVYDDVTYNVGYVQMRNSTEDRSLHFMFDEASGRIEMIYGWSKQPIPGEDWSYMSLYYKHYQSLSTGANAITLNDGFSTGVTVNIQVDVAVGGPSAALIYNYFPMNPTNVSITNGTAIVYFDQLFENYGLITGNITMTITLPSSIDVDDIIAIFGAFNMSGTNQWDEAPPEFYDYVIYDSATNSITIETGVWDTSVISMMAYVLRSATTTEPSDDIPGYDLFMISLMIIIISGLFVRKMRKK